MDIVHSVARDVTHRQDTSAEEGEVRLCDDGVVEGWARLHNGWGGGEHVAYFALEVSEAPAAVGTYLLHGPAVRRCTVHAEERDLVIDAPTASRENIYVQSARLNGAPLERAWVRHRELTGGARLEFEMGAEPSDWGREDLPPSPAG